MSSANTIKAEKFIYAFTGKSLEEYAQEILIEHNQPDNDLKEVLYVSGYGPRTDET